MAQPPALDQMFAFFAVVHDPRRQPPTTLHALETLLTLPSLATICGAQHWVESAHWGKAKAAWLAEFLDRAPGMPSHDTLGRVCAVCDPASRHPAFVSWMQALADLSQGLAALEGKTIRQSLDSADGKGPMHVVHAWASANEVGLAQFQVASKINESTAPPEFLRMLHLAGAVVTIDAMGCQVEIARQMQEQEADYVRSVKANQPSLYRDCTALFAWLRSPLPLAQPVVFGDDEQVDGGQGRSETRRVWSTAALAGVVSCERWPGLASLGIVESIRQLGAEDRGEQRDYLSTLPGATDAAAKRVNRVIGTHGDIANRVHWVLDVAMGEDANRTWKGNSAQNLALMRNLALNLLRHEHSVQVGIAAKQKRTGWDHDYLLKILSQT